MVAVLKEGVIETEDSVSVQIKGLAKSGRWWKSSKQRFSSMPKSKPLRASWQRKMLMKAENSNVKEFQKRLSETRRQEKIEYRKRVEAHRKKKEENQKKSEIVQVIRNTAKIKRMKKKQLRQIEKRDTSAAKTKKV